jgi:hypothetical protein
VLKPVKASSEKPEEEASASDSAFHETELSRSGPHDFSRERAIVWARRLSGTARS